MRRLEDLLYATINPPMRALLRSRFHGIASSRNLCLLSFTGRRSGRAITTPLSFMREGNLVRLLSSHQTQWWKNFRGDGQEVIVEIARTKYPGHAQALIEDGEQFRNGIRRFLSAVPRDAVVYGIGLDQNRKPKEDDIERAAGHVVLVEIEIR